jgi:lipoprotein-releasing system ATP-binding protein
MNDVPFVDAVAIEKSYAVGTSKVSVLRGLDLSVAKGEMVAVVGASGVGKSTLLHVLGGLDTIDGGRIRIGDAVLFDMKPDALVAFRNRHVGFVFQFHHLLPEFTALDNVAMPLRIRRVASAEARERAAEALTQVGLGERLAHRPSQLSGGERQRVAIARALAGEPDCVLADEPTGNLDRVTADAVFALMLELTRRRAMAFVLVSHDETLARRCDRLLHLAQGRLVP